MIYAPPILKARHIARSAQQLIKNETGMGVTLLLCPTEDPDKAPERMLQVIAIALELGTECFRMRTRNRNVAELRFLGAVFLRRHFPKITLQQIAALFGGQDHTSIMSGITRAYNLIYTRDPRFIKKYNTVVRAINLWLRKQR